MKLAGSEKTCPQCSRKLTTRGKRSGKSGKKPSKSIKTTCWSCGALVSQRSRRCSSCKADLSAVAGKARIQPVEKMVTEIKPEITEREPTEKEKEYKRSPCPSCGWLQERKESNCPKCGMSLEDVGQKEELIAQMDLRPVDESHEQVSVAEEVDTKSCPACAAIVPKSLQRCPICQASFIETPPKTEVGERGAELPEAPRPEGPTVPSDERGMVVGKVTVKRKLRSAKVTTVPVDAHTRTSGRTNGVGAVNGLGKVNGTGLVNGTGMAYGTEAVKKTGMLDEGERRPTVGAARRTTMNIRWQLLAVLLAIAVVVPTFLFLSSWNKPDKFSIDGSYAEWESATTYGTMIQSTAPSSNITEWAIGTQSSDLFLYFRTETTMMSSPEAESYYLFVDSDGSGTTGYIMGPVGADYMLQLTGWDSEIQSSSLSQYASPSDQYNWSAWTLIGSLSHSLDGERLEASAHVPETIGQSAKFVLISKDPADRGSVSYTAPLKGGVLVVRQAPSADVAATGVITRSPATEILTLRFSCEGAGGSVSRVTPALVGAPLARQVSAFSLEKGEEHETTIAVDTSSAVDGQLVSAELFPSSISSTFANVQIIGSGASAYAAAPPPMVSIDGAFADWNGRLSADNDPAPVTSPGFDINEVGNLSTSLTSFFYVSVEGEMCSGTFIPAKVAKPSGAGGGTFVPTRHTAEDILRIYVDSDRSNSTGEVVTLDSKRIGADQKIEVRGLFGNITSKKEFDYSSTSKTWVESAAPVEAAKDEKRIEISVSATSLGGSEDVDFIVETSSWEGRRDLATFETFSRRAFMSTWIVDPSTTSMSATSMSHQRKIFFDGVNYWSFYFDGAHTAYKYSTDGGITWSSPSRAFVTDGVNKVSLWYDSAGDIVYAVGDTGVPSRTVTVQRGTVDPAMHTITWSPTDGTLIASLNNQADKNTFISKDSSGYLWVLSSNNTGIVPIRQDLSAFRSSAVDSVTSWAYTGNLVGGGNNLPNCKGSILPAGKGSDMWAIYAYGGNVASRKYATFWSTENIIYAIGVGNQGNTDNAPPSTVVDSKGVVHVVYGTGRKSGSSSAPTIEYSHNETDKTAFTKGLDLDPSIPSRLGDYYPTISVEIPTGNLYVLWLQSDDTLTPRTVIGRSCVTGTWSEMTIEHQTTFAKQYLTSAYSVSDEFKLCWQWTQNTTAPIQVLFDSFPIPEFTDLTPLASVSIVILAVYRTRQRKKDDPSG